MNRENCTVHAGDHTLTYGRREVGGYGSSAPNPFLIKFGPCSSTVLLKVSGDTMIAPSRATPSAVMYSIGNWPLVARSASTRSVTPIGRGIAPAGAGEVAPSAG